MTTLTVNQNNALKLLADAFSARTTFVTELMQNARRAGATEIYFRHANNDLRVSDNGCGVRDFNKLLTLCESGWSQDVQESDTPYGVGFLSAIMASSEFTVTSNGKTLHAVTDELLAGVPATITHNDESPVGTTITLKLRNAIDLQRVLDLSARTFPIQVYRNGMIQSHNLALGIAPYSIEIPGLGTLVWDGYLGSGSTLGSVSYALQGLPISFGRTANSYDTGYYRNWVVHLDQTKFRGRMPDREAVIWQPEFEGLTDHVNTAQKELLRRRWLESCLAPSLDLYRVVAYELGHNMLDMVEAIPAGVFRELVEAPERSLVEGEHLDWRAVDVITRDNMHTLTYILDFPGTDGGDNIAALRAMYASDIAERRHPVPAWVKCREISYDTVRVEYGTYDRKTDEFTAASGPVPTVVVDMGRYWSLTVQPCEAVRVSLIDEDENIVASTVEYDFTPTVDGVLYLTGNSEQVDNYVFRQDYDFLREDSEYDWDWDKINALCSKFTVEYKLAQGKDPAVLVENALASVANRTSLWGKSYVVGFASSGTVVTPAGEQAALLLEVAKTLRYVYAFHGDLPNPVVGSITECLRKLGDDV